MSTPYDIIRRKVALSTKLSLALLLTAAATTAGGLPVRAATLPSAVPAFTAYAVSGSTLVPINSFTKLAGTRVQAGATSRDVAITPDGRTAYVVTTGSTVIPVSLVTGTAGAPIPVLVSPGYNLGRIAITSDGRTAYVTSATGVNGETGSVTPIDVKTNVAGPPIALPNTVYGLAITPDGKSAYVGLPYEHAIVPINLSKRSVGAEIALPGSPQDVAITPDGSSAYVTMSFTGSVAKVNLWTAAVSQVPIGLDWFVGYGMAFTPGGSTLYVAGVQLPPVGTTPSQRGFVVPIIVATNAVAPPVPIAAGESDAVAIAVTRDGAQAYVTDIVNGTVVPLDISAGVGSTRVLAPIPGISFSTAVVVAPAAFRVYPNPYWSGYVVQDQSTFVSGEWTVPAVNCALTPQGQVATWVGLGSSTLEQIGVLTACSGGQASNCIALQMLPQQANGAEQVCGVFPLLAGDDMIAQVRYNNGSQFDLRLQDVTRSWIFEVPRTQTSMGPDALSSSDWITEDPKFFGPVQLAAFDTVHLRNCTYGRGLSLAAGAHTLQNVVVGGGGVVKLAPSLPVTPSSGGAFDVRWVSS